MVHRLSKPASSARRARRESSGPMCAASVPSGKPASEIPSFIVTMVAGWPPGIQGPVGPWVCQYHPRAARWGDTVGMEAQTAGMEGEGIGAYIQAWRHRVQPADVGLPG